MGDTEIEELRRASAESRRAIVSNDAGLIANHFGDDWVLVDRDGIGTREQFLTSVSSGALTHTEMTLIDGTERIRVHGETGVVTGRVTNTAHYGGREFHADEWVTDVYRRTPNGWVCVHSHVTPAGP